MIALRPALPTDIPALVALNAAVVQVTSAMDAARCADLLALRGVHLVAEREGAVLGFVLAMLQGAAYDNANFAWFSARLNHFVYVDRIVLGARARGHGLGTRLYDALADRVREAGCLVMAAEMDLDPPNAPSLAFHAARGFAALGTRRYADGKVVSMQVKGLTG